MLLSKIAVSVGSALSLAAACTTPAGAVVGGGEAAATTAPYQVSVLVSGLRGDHHECGGVLVGAKSVVTAAQCTDRNKATDLKVKYGGLDRTRLAVTQTVTHINQHESFNGALGHDVAVLTLASEIQTTGQVRTINLASTSPAPGTELTVTGWGITQPDATSLATNLRTVREQVATPQACQAADEGPRFALGASKEGRPLGLASPPVLDGSMLCGAPVTEGESLCTGDGGGPAVADGALVGIASWNTGCGRNGTDDVFTSITALLPWLVSKIQ
ncbi:S1 family serine peptidase [Streptomyces zaomyceticus]|uniref:S1 family serine peptidase n=1 Tax=Streptomyces zaomyceticus TaxID=68286 RepID=UPI0037AD6620